MNAVRRLLGVFQDSPTYGRDRANLASGSTIGGAALLLNGIVLLMVLPLMMAPDDRDFRVLTENIEFGQLLGLILLGGATAFATFLIPFRLSTVFMGPRVGRYFDQIVLSGISPMRFVIGKALSQNLFLGLILFLLLPYLVLSIALGGLQPVTFLAGVFLVWLYCMTLALVTLWLSLYVNEIIAAFAVIAAATFLSIMGCVPLPFQPFLVTPFPVLIQPIYSTIQPSQNYITADYWTRFIGCSASLSATIMVSLFAIYIGPLYGIIRENSTFGEVVRPGDSKRKRWLRIRHHIQRPSEISFFYENRSDTFRSSEGFIRWGGAFAFLVLLSCGASVTFVYGLSVLIAAWGPPGGGNWAFGFHAFYLTIHGISMFLGACVFSHAKNTTFMRLPFLGKRTAEVAKLDTTFFLIFAVISTAASIASPYCFEHFLATESSGSIFSVDSDRYADVNFVRIVFEGTAVISIAGLVVYALNRLLCLNSWLKSVGIVGTVCGYLGLFCFIPFLPLVLLTEIRELQSIEWFASWVPVLSMASPFTMMGHLFGELGSRFPKNISTLPFYILHSTALCLLLMGIRGSGRKLRKSYLYDSLEDKA